MRILLVFRRSLAVLFLGLVGLAWCAAAHAQGVLVVIHPPHPVPLPRPLPQPTPPEVSYRVKELAVQARIVDQVAQVQIAQTFVNTGSRLMEAQFLFPLPYDAAIERLTFLVDGKEYEGKVLPAKQAREIYEAYVRRNQDPALLEWMGHGMVQTSVFPIPPGAERKVILQFSQLLRKHGTITDFLFPLATARYTSAPLDSLSVNLSVESAGEIKNIYSPTHKIEVKRPDATHATVSYELKNSVPNTDFRLFYDAAPGKFAASVLSYRPTSDDGYFLLLASPELQQAMAERSRKTVIFVVDRSGSMIGKKMDQAKEAAKFVLNNLHDGDNFNIVAYDSTVQSFKPELQRYDASTRAAALGFVEGLFAGGSTNIEGALSLALDMIKEKSQPNYILFLTDGIPTQGETSEAKLAAAAKAKNGFQARLITLGVGYDVNSRLLDRLAVENFGQSEYVRPDEQIEAHVSRLYSRLTSPILTDVKLTIDVEGAKIEAGPVVNRLYPKEVHDIFAGEQLLIVGRYKQSGAGKITLAGQLAGEHKSFDFPAQFAEKTSDASLAFVEKLWATRRIGEIIDLLDLQGKNEELIKELVALSVQHGILTPYTSFLADDQPQNRLSDARRGLERAAAAVDALEMAEGRAGVAQRAEKNLFKAAGAAPAGPAASSNGVKVNAYRDIATDREVVTESVQQVADQAIYRRGKTWIAANAQHVDLDRDAGQITKVSRFSPEYFELAKGNSDAENAIFAQQARGEQLLIQLRGKVYLID